jgi:hypothetical protein
MWIRIRIRIRNTAILYCESCVTMHVGGLTLSMHRLIQTIRRHLYDYPTKRTKAISSITTMYFDDEGQRCCSL